MDEGDFPEENDFAIDNDIDDQEERGYREDVSKNFFFLLDLYINNIFINSLIKIKQMVKRMMVVVWKS
jgi:hypothetical protein